MNNDVVKRITIRDSNLAGALAWLGFPHIKVRLRPGVIGYIFEGDEQLDEVIKALQEVKNLYKGE